MQKSGNNNYRTPVVKKETSFGELFLSVCSSIKRTTIRFFKNLPNKVVDYVKRRINDYKRKPQRKDINKVYVLVGYTTKRHIDAKYNAERNLIILRRGLLALIFVLIIFISINSILPKLKVGKYSDIFGISSMGELAENDPFAKDN